MFTKRSGRLFASLALAGLIGLAPVMADAKMGGGSFGSRGSRTFSAPPSTRTAPGAAPIERSITPPPAAQPGPAFQQPGFGAGARSMGGGGFGRGLLGGLAGGLIGAGLFGLLTGHGLLGGIEGFAGFIGLILQIGVIFLLARLAYRWFLSRSVAPMGGAAGFRPQGAAAGTGFMGGHNMGFGGGPATAGFASGAPPRAQTSPLAVEPEDFNAFERILIETQNAYSREDVSGLQRFTTREVADTLEVDIARNRGKGVVNRISGVKLLQGDLSEAWREGQQDYATVAMRFSLVDVVEDRETGKIVSGDPAKSSESTEVWTFLRPSGSGPSGWRLSALQQTA